MNIKEAASQKNYTGDRAICNHHCESIILYMVKNYLHFVESEDALPCKQDIATHPYPEP
jgi:hypothetical protein